MPCNLSIISHSPQKSSNPILKLHPVLDHSRAFQTVLLSPSSTARTTIAQSTWSHRIQEIMAHSRNPGRRNGGRIEGTRYKIAEFQQSMAILQSWRNSYNQVAIFDQFPTSASIQPSFPNSRTNHSIPQYLEHNPAKLHQNLGFKEPASRTVCRANAMGLQRHWPPVQCSSWIQHNPLSFIILQSQQSLVIMWYQPRSLFQELSIVHRHPAIALSYNLLNPNAIIKSIHSPTIPSEELVEG